MSQQSEGQGWWHGEDGLWYPPERHPDPSHATTLQLDEPSPTWHRLFAAPLAPADADYSHLPPPPEPGSQRNPQFGRVAPPNPNDTIQPLAVIPTSRSRSGKVKLAFAAIVAIALVAAAIGGVIFVLTNSSDDPTERIDSPGNAVTMELDDDATSTDG